MAETSFKNFNIDQSIIRAVELLGYTEPTRVQAQVIPVALENKDIVVKSQTGSGKTAAFAIPICSSVIVEQKDPQALVLAPTRELAVQIKEDINNLGRYRRIRGTAIFGKQPMDIQVNELKQRVHIIVGTPGRTLDHIKRGNINTSTLKYLVIDEADEMLGLGFIEQVEEIMAALPGDKCTMLFSATLPDEIHSLCSEYMKDPEFIELNPEKLTVELIEQVYYKVEEDDKFEILKRILYVENPDSSILFCKTKENVDKLVSYMKKQEYSCAELHGGMSQNERLDVMKSFKRGEFRFLAATDVAARGIDIEKVTHIINFDVPVEKERYVHRIGRTGRAGSAGKAISLVTPSEERLFDEIQKYINMTITKGSIPSKEESESNKKAFLMKNKEKPVLKQDKSRQLSKSVMKLYIGAGKDKKIRAGDIVGAITSIEGVKPENIGIIDIQDRYSHVDIMDGKGKTVLEALNNTKIKGKKVKVEKANK